MTAQTFIHPAFARTAPDPRPIPWDRDVDVRALAEYIRAVLAVRQREAGNPPAAH